MKKILSLVFGLIMCLGCGIALAACGKVTLKSISIESGLNRSVLVGEELDTSNVVATVKWSDGKTETITSADLVFGEIDTTTPGTKDLTITYTKEDYTFVVKIKVGATDAEVESIIRMESKLLTQYNANVGVSQAEKTGFKDDEDKTSKRIYVGDDNAFNFRIAATGIDGEGEDIELASLQTTVTVKLVEGDTKTTLTGDALTQYVSVNPTNAVLDFTEDAIGHVFEVTVDAVKKGAYPVKPFTATLTVVDGFNVYDALDLSVYDNKYNNLSETGKQDAARNHFGYLAKHAQVMAKYGMTADEIAGIKAMILQNNITLHRADVPSAFFWQSETSWSNKNGIPAVAGTLINHDSDGIYYRFVEDGDTFSFIGNYFKIDTSEFPRAVVQVTEASSVPGENKYVNSDPDNLSAMEVECQALFYTTGNEKAETGRDESEENGGAQIYWKNLAFNGNGELTNDPKNSGSLLLSKFAKSHSYINNNIVTNHYIAYLVRKYKGNEFWQHKTTTEIVDCKGYSCYQCLVYVAGTDEGTIIKDSEFVGANGPAIIADYLREDDLDRHIPVYLDVINSKIESKITGREQWFITYGASGTVGQIVGLEQVFDGTNEDLAAAGLTETPITLISTNASGAQAVNAAVLCKLDRVDLDVSERMNGKIRFFDTQAQYEAQEALQAAFEQELAAMLLQASQETDEQKQQQFVLTQAQALVAKYKAESEAGRLVYGLDMDRTYTWLTMGKDLWTNYARDMAIAIGMKQAPEMIKNQYLANVKQRCLDNNMTEEQANAYIAQESVQNEAEAYSEDMMQNHLDQVQAMVEGEVDKNTITDSQGIADYSLGTTIFVESDASMGYLSLGDIRKIPQMSALPTQAGPVGAFFADADTKYINVYLPNGMAIILQASRRTAA